MEYDFYYLLPIDSKMEHVTPFQGFSAEILRVSHFIPAVLHLPTSIVELLAPRDGSISARASGHIGYKILPIDENSIEELLSISEMPFTCIISDESNFKNIASFIKSYPKPVFHSVISTSEGIDP
jgi:hypothetical protein